MGWLVDLDDDEQSRSIATCLRRVDPAETWTTTTWGTTWSSSTSGAGVVICSRASTELHHLLRAAVADRRQPVVLSRAGAVLDPWPLLAAGAIDVVEWTGDPGPISARLRRQREIDDLVSSPAVTGSIRGSSPALREALRMLVTVARYGTGPILVLGETGTGKELAARVAHELRVADGRGHLVVVDCTTIVPSLSGSELFGHERGAFTGALSVRTGACAAANGGTLLLDEVGELPLELQSELLRVVQEGTYKRVGSDTWQTTRFRLICATNRDLEAEVAAGRFRADFYYRIAASVVRMPPLRDRLEDVVPLFCEFVAHAQGGVEPPQLAPVLEHALRCRPYPGNLRDLRQLALRVAARHVGSGPLTPGDLAPIDRPESVPTGSAGPDGMTRLDGTTGRDGMTGPTLADAVRAQLGAGLTLRDLRERVADLAVRLTLQECGGNVRAAAARLGVTDRALHLRRAQNRNEPTGGVSSRASSE
jgi:transcriptional regulator with GAF, ATPase, and Fis domain